MFKPLLLIFIAAILQTSCAGDECEGVPSNTESKTVKDTLFLETGKEYYIPQLPNMVFANGNNTIQFDSVQSTQNLVFREVSNDFVKTTCGQEMVRQQVASQQQIVAYKSSLLPKQLTINRTKRVESLPHFDSAIINTWKDIVIVSVDNSSFSVPLDGKTDSAVTFYTSYVLGTKTYDSIYQCNNPSNINGGTANTLFYNTKNGVLGYKLNSGELWIRQ